MFLEKRQPVTHAVAAGAFVLLSPLSSPRPFHALLALLAAAPISSPPWMRALQSS